jgi:hypothetical protein
MIGTIAVTGQEVLITGLDREPPNVFPAEWLRREQILSFRVTPISCKGEVLGVVVAFSRICSTGQAGAWPDVLNHHIAGAVANARAFEEIERLKVQLECNRPAEPSYGERGWCGRMAG